MAVLVFSEISQLVKDDLQIDVTTDPPFATAELARGINDAWAQVFELSGGRTKTANHAALWTTSPAVAGTQTMAGAITTIGEVLHVWVGTTVGSTGESSGDTELTKVDLSEIRWHRSNASSTVLGVYAESKLYAVSRLDTTTVADVNKVQLDVWPASAGTRYYPAHYIPQFSEIDSVTVTTPSCNDLESRDIAHLAAMAMAPRIDRADLVEAIALKVSEGTRLALDRKMSAMIDSRADR